MLTALVITLVNGLPVTDPAHALSVEERGLAYGDGVFETMLLRDGAINYLDQHLARLKLGCERLGIVQPSAEVIRADLATLIAYQHSGIVKLIVTRGANGRGYRCIDSIPATRIALLYPPLPDERSSGIRTRWCTTRLARNPALTGIKHLNRLEQVLAQNEWQDANIEEGFMLDTEGELICATSSNVFIVNEGVLRTPDLRFSGVCGVMREAVLAAAHELGLTVEEGALWPDDLLNAAEVFVTNAVRGIRPVVAVDDKTWVVGPTTNRLISKLGMERGRTHA